jgi:hypothetical protein
MSRQIYSLLPLAAWVPLPDREPRIFFCPTSSVNGGPDEPPTGRSRGRPEVAPCATAKAAAEHNAVVIRKPLPSPALPCIIGMSEPFADN